MTDRWGLTYPLQGISLADHGPILREAEELGYTDAWSAEVDANDAFTPLAAFAVWAPNTRLGCAIAGIYNRTPTLLAQTSAAIEELAPGRFVLGIGTSSPAIVERWNGVPLAQPMKRTRDTIAFLKQAWSGEKVVMKVGPYDVKGFRLGRAPSPPPQALRRRIARADAAPRRRDLRRRDHQLHRPVRRARPRQDRPRRRAEGRQEPRRLRPRLPHLRDLDGGQAGRRDDRPLHRLRLPDHAVLLRLPRMARPRRSAGPDEEPPGTPATARAPSASSPPR